MHVWNMLYAARWNTGRKNHATNRHLRTIAELFWVISLQLRHVSTIAKIIKQQYLVHTFSQYGELRPIKGWDRLASLGHTSKFQRVSRLGFVTAPTLLNEGQPNFARCWAISWAATLYIYIFLGSSCPLKEFCQVHRSHFVEVLRSAILAKLLHNTRAVCVCVRQTLRRATRKGIRLLSLLVCATYIPQGGHHVGHRPTL